MPTLAHRPQDCSCRNRRIGKKNLSLERIRRSGGGAACIEEKYPQLHVVFKEIINTHQAGCPMTTSQWTHLSVRKLVLAFAEKNIRISTTIVRYLLAVHGYGLRKLAKTRCIAESEYRNAQFEQIEALVASKQACPKTLLISIDTKKKEPLGCLFRAGNVYTQGELSVYDHDYANLATGTIAPHGVYDMKANQCYLHIGTSADTADFALESLMQWWDKTKEQHSEIAEIIIFSDGGGSNRASGYLYKAALQQLANYTQKIIRACHYPPYCSKYNPIEHRAFPHITKAWAGIVLDQPATAKQLAEQKATTNTGFRTIVSISDTVFEKGKKIPQEVIDALNITSTNDNLKKWNYSISPNNSDKNAPQASVMPKSA